MEAELVELFQVASKAADAAAVKGKGGRDNDDEDERRCIDALQRLKSFPVTTQILISTQVGKRLRRLTKHPWNKIQALASDLMQLWKKVVMEESKACKKNGSVHHLNKSSSYQSETKKRKSEPNGPPGSQTKSRSGVGVTEKKRDFDLNKLPPESAEPPTPPVTPCNDPMRDRVRELLFEALSRVSGEASKDIIDEVNACDPSSIAVSVESTMFQHWGHINGTHKVKYRSIVFNIKDPNNPDFRRKVLLGHIKPERLLSMTTEEMASEERQLQNQRIKEKALSKCELEAAPKATTDQFIVRPMWRE